MFLILLTANAKKTFLINIFLLCFIQIESTSKLPTFELTNKEILEFANDLRRFDLNRAKSNQIKIDYQGHTSTRDTDDSAKSKLFKSVDESLFSYPTYAKLLALYNNYIFETGKREQVTAEENKEIDELIDLLIETKVFRFLKNFLHEKDHPFANSQSTFRQWVRQLWFGQYSRARGAQDTSGFEHVFIGEAKNGEVSGMHNWIRFYQLERNATANHFDYKGFLVKRFNAFAAVKFTMGKYLKRSGGFFIGTSPEFDFAIYTFCFLARRGHSSTCDIEFDGCPISITSFDIIQDGRVYIGSAYPSAGRITDKCREIASQNN